MTRRWQGRLSDPDSTKEGRFRCVAEAVAQIVLAHGTKGVTISSVARRAGVSRPWIYKYLGRDPKVLLRFAGRLYAEAFSDLARSRHADDVSTWRARVADGVRDGLHDALAAPWCVPLYFRHRHADDALGEAIRTVERRHREAFLADLPPPLVREDASRFAEVFTATRMGAYHLWLDPGFRARTSVDAMLDELLRPLDAWIGAADR